MSFYAPRQDLHEDPEQLRSGRVRLHTIAEYLEWGKQVVSIYLDHNMLSLMDRTLPYFPSYADDSMDDDDTAHWAKMANNVVLAEFRANGVHRPVDVVEYDADEFAPQDALLNKHVRIKMNNARVHAHKLKELRFENAMIEFNEKYEEEVALTVTSLQNSAYKKIWKIIVNTLGDNFQMVTSMTRIGNMTALLAEINAVLHLDVAQDVMATRALLQCATFEKEGLCLLSSWKFFINHQVQRLKMLGAPYSEQECVTTFLKGLPAIPFSTFRQQVYNSKESFITISDLAHAYAAQPDSKLQLEQLLTSKQRAGHRAAPQIFAVAPAPIMRVCYDFANGSCRRDPCRFSHTAPPPPAAAKFSAGHRIQVSCTHCGKPGHTVDSCFGIHGFPPSHRGGGGKRGSKGGKGQSQYGNGRGAPGGPRAKSFVNALAQSMSTSDDSEELADLLKTLLAQHKQSKRTHTPEVDAHDQQQFNYMCKVVVQPVLELSTTQSCLNQKQSAMDIGNKQIILPFPKTTTATNLMATTSGLFPDAGNAKCQEGVSQSIVLKLNDVMPNHLSSSILLDGVASIHATNMLDACFTDNTMLHICDKLD